MLKLSGLSVSYAGMLALRNVSLEVNEGELVTIVGPNGAGKTTFLKAIAGTVANTCLSMAFCGNEVSRMPPHMRARMGIAHVPEGRRIFKSMTVLENLEMGCYRSEARTNRAERFDEVFALFPILKERRRGSAASLSGGEQQMLALGRALMAAPHLLLLDEPSQGLAPRIVDIMFESIDSIRRRRKISILLVEQRVAEAIELCDRAHILDTGEIVLSGTRDEMLKSNRVQSAYLGMERVSSDKPR